MAFTTFSGPVRSGTVREGAGLTGDVVGNVDALAFKIPQGSQIVDITVDHTVAATAGTTTVSVGSTSGGAELMAAVATTAGGRFRGTATASTQAAWQTSTSADTSVYVRVAVGTATLTAGQFIVTVSYVQRASNGAQNPASA